MENLETKPFFLAIGLAEDYFYNVNGDRAVANNLLAQLMKYEDKDKEYLQPVRDAIACGLWFGGDYFREKVKTASEGLLDEMRVQIEKQ